MLNVNLAQLVSFVIFTPSSLNLVGLELKLSSTIVIFNFGFAPIAPYEGANSFGLNIYFKGVTGPLCSFER